MFCKIFDFLEMYVLNITQDLYIIKIVYRRKTNQRNKQGTDITKKPI